ncbi:MAG: hypothetical protein R3B54_04565 [Bdellovibrionota bacterium]
MKRLVLMATLLMFFIACERFNGGNGGSEVGNGGDPEYITVEHGLRYAYGLLERVDPTKVPPYLVKQYSTSDLNWFALHRADLVKALKNAELHWVEDLPSFCKDHTVACARVNDPRIYVVKRETSRFGNHRDAAGHMIHEAVHLIGESSEDKANRTAVLALAAWKNMGHPEAPHWVGMADSPLTDEDIYRDPHLLRWQYVDWNDDRLYVWDERYFQAYDPIRDAWDIKTVQKNAFDWKRSKGNFATETHYPKWLRAGGIVYVACRFRYPALKQANAAGVFLDRDQASWRAVTSEEAPSDRMRIGLTKTATQLIVWGGQSCSNTPIALNTGAFYHPVEDKWETIEVRDATPTPRYGHGLLWTGDQLVVWGGVSVYQNPGELGVAELVNDGAFYDPAEKTWKPIEVDEATPSPV